MKFSEYLKFLIYGTLFGFVLMKSEVVSWFRIQEMFQIIDPEHLEGFRKRSKKIFDP